MRRFVVIFLLFLLPIQVLAESLTDLSYDALYVPIALTDTTALTTNPSPEASVVTADLPKPHQIEHADLHDSLHSASSCSYHALIFQPCFVYQLSSQPLSYPPLRKPPRL